MTRRHHKDQRERCKCYETGNYITSATRKAGVEAPGTHLKAALTLLQHESIRAFRWSSFILSLSQVRLRPDRASPQHGRNRF